MFGRATFDKLLDKATINQVEPDWTTILQICDVVRQGDCPPKTALASIKKKLGNPNPRVATHSLNVLESLVKNCGHLIHDEVGTKPFMDHLHDVVKTTPHEQVRMKILEMIQVWAHAFRSNPKYNAVQETVNSMRSEGYKFPALKESDAMFSSDTAPAWVDANVCHRCRTSFGLVMRKHHCRACGNVFCTNCSSKTSTLPKFGIEKEVRVCDTCYEIYNKPRSRSPHSKSESDTLPMEYVTSSLAQQNQAPKAKKTEEELKEEEELHLALALSQSEAEAKEKEKKRVTSEIMSNAATMQRSKTPTAMKDEDEEEDPELARYLNRSYWEQRQASDKTNDKKRSSSPDHFRMSPAGPPSAPTTPTHQLENGEVSESELNDFVGFLKSQVEIFVNRMKSNSSRGRSISNDSSVQKLFMNVTTNHSRLLKYIHQQDDSRVYYEGLQDKLAQVKDAMMALDALRDEHREKLRREAEEAERLKQLQMAQKLHIMRKKKQEYLQYQRQLAIQKVQEQEREMQMRQEQQKQQYLMGTMGMPQGYMSWDPNLGNMQQRPQQYGQPQSMQASYMPPGGYPGPNSMMQQQPNQMMSLGMVPSGMMPGQPQSMPPQGPQSLPPQGPQSLPPQGPQNLPPQGPQSLQHQGGPPRVPPTQSSHMGPMPLTQVHSLPPSNYQGLPLPNQGMGQGQMLPTQSPINIPSAGPQMGLPPGPPQNVGLPHGQPPNVALPPGQQNVGLPPGPPQNVGMPPGNQPRLGNQQTMVMPQVHPQNITIQTQGVNLSQGPPQNIVMPPGAPQQNVGSQQYHQQQLQQPVNDPNLHSSSTGELISFD